MADQTTDAIPATLQPFAVPVDSLRPYSRNPRQGDVGAIVSSLKRHGQYRPIVVNARTKEVLAGNHTLRAVSELGWTEIAATFVDVDDDTAARIVLIDNRANDLAAYDDSELVALLQSLPDLEGTGYDGDDLDDLLRTLTGSTGDRAGDDTDPIDPPADPVTQPGDRIILGDHVLVCGDSTDEHTVQQLLDGEIPDIIATDPPYGVAYQTNLSPEEAKRLRRRSDGKEVANDALTPDATYELFRDALTRSGLKPGGVIYATVPPGGMTVLFIRAIDDAFGDGTARHGLVWVKDQFVLGRSDYHYRHETILYGWREGAAHYFIDDRTLDTVWEIPRPRRSDEHPTMKPVPLFERMLTNSSRRGDLVYEPFGGSGTTLLAAENLGRHARLIELDPAYCDVIVDRWERHTSRTADRPEHEATHA